LRKILSIAPDLLEFAGYSDPGSRGAFEGRGAGAKRIYRIGKKSGRGRVCLQEMKFSRVREGEVLVEKINVLQPREFDGEAIVDMAHDPGLQLANADQCAERGPFRAGHGRA